MSNKFNLNSPKLKVNLAIIILTIFIMITNSLIGQVAVSEHEKGMHSHSGSGVIFSGFPLHEEDYTADVQEIMKEAIAKYGEEEWRLVVLTSELHGHLGIYAIIGAKMGLFGREILNAGHDELVILSHAGSKPPVSCMNDGLQVSTGATLGHGLISVNSINPVSPVADFTYAGKTIRLALKDDINREVEASIKEVISLSGGLTDTYWQRVRELALGCWLEFDRKDIFDISDKQ